MNKSRLLFLTADKLIDGLNQIHHLQVLIENFAVVNKPIPVFDAVGGSVDHVDFEMQYNIFVAVPECNLKAFDEYFNIPQLDHLPL